MIGKCRICNSELEVVKDFGNIFVSDFVDNKGQGERGSLNYCSCTSCGLTQLSESYSPEKMYKQYWYRSGTNEQMRYDLGNIVECAKRWVSLSKGDWVLDIGANDGTLLSKYPESIIKVGVDPSQLIIDEGPKNVSGYLVQDFFPSSKTPIPPDGYKVVTAIAMFYDIEKPVEFLNSIAETLNDAGIVVLQLSYTPLMYAQNAWDNICHEHILYYTFKSLSQVVEDSELSILDVELNDVNCGSFRIYLKKTRSLHAFPEYKVSIGNQHINMLEEYESNQLNLVKSAFVSNIEKSCEDLVTFLRDNKGKVLGFGASTKGNTLLQVAGITQELLPFIAERQLQKVGKLTVGSNIPIISEQEMRSRNPEYLLVLPWTFISNFLSREEELIKGGTKFVTPLPFLKIWK